MAALFAASMAQELSAIAANESSFNVFAIQISFRCFGALRLPLFDFAQALLHLLQTCTKNGRFVRVW